MKIEIRIKKQPAVKSYSVHQSVLTDHWRSRLKSPPARIHTCIARPASMWPRRKPTGPPRARGSRIAYVWLRSARVFSFEGLLTVRDKSQRVRQHSICHLHAHICQIEQQEVEDLLRCRCAQYRLQMRTPGRRKQAHGGPIACGRARSAPERDFGEATSLRTIGE